MGTSASSAADTPLWLDQPAIRRMLLGELLERVAGGAALQAIAGAGLGAAFWNSPHRLAAVVAGLAVAALLAMAVAVQRSGVVERLSTRRVAAASRVARAFGFAIGTAWAVALVLMLPGAEVGQRAVVLAIVAVLMAEGQRFAAERPIALAYVAPIAIGASIGFAMGGADWWLVPAVGAPCWGWFLVTQGARAAAASRRRIETDAIVTAQSATIDTLLLDFDEEASDWLWRTDADSRVTHLSAGAEGSIAAFDDAKDKPFAALFGRHGGRSSDGARGLLAVMAAKKPFRNRLVEVVGQPEPQWWRLSGKPLFDATGAFLGYRGVGSDVSGARNSESRISYLANFDALTGFANRTNFQAFAARQCAAAAADGVLRALLCLDLDGFKNVNDSLGHEAGDELLKQVAARLTAAVPAGTFLARVGGDEFALWMSSTTPAKVDSLAKELTTVLRQPFEVNGLTVEIGGSFGIALTPKHGTDAGDLLTKADLALYRAKSEGKGRAKLFEEVFETTVIERRKLEGDIKLALARGEFTLHYQPLVETNEGRVVCFEALIRWDSPERGFVAPAAFVPAAEGAGLIGAIGRYVLFEACRAAASWPPDVQVAVNVSPPHVRSSDFLKDVTMALKASGLHPSRLQIEVTEGVFLDRSNAASDALQTLRERGVQIALDDFGTGYSSLNYLVDFPVDKIKIDRAFIRDLVDSSAHQAIVDAMLGLARRLSIRVTAEGVETKEQAIALKRRRCDDLQGFLLSKPRPAVDVPAMIIEVPRIFRQAIPMHMESPLAMVLAARKPESGQAA